MLSGIVNKIISKYLGKYIDGLDKFKLGLFSFLKILYNFIFS